MIIYDSLWQVDRLWYVLNDNRLRRWSAVFLCLGQGVDPDHIVVRSPSADANLAERPATWVVVFVPNPFDVEMLQTCLLSKKIKIKKAKTEKDKWTVSDPKLLNITRCESIGIYLQPTWGFISSKPPSFSVSTGKETIQCVAHEVGWVYRAGQESYPLVVKHCNEKCHL